MDGDATLLSPLGPEQGFAMPPRTSHLLVLTGADATERRIPLGRDPVLIGRAPPCEILLSGGAVSRRHCRVQVVGDHAEVTDLGSTNGTQVNGACITEPTVIQHGAIIQIGSHRLVHECRTARELEEAQAVERELEAASRYLHMLLPKPIRDGAVRADWLFLPSARLGGNAFGYRFIEQGVFAGFMIDVAGHGTEAAMHAVGIMNLLRQNEVGGTTLAEPARMLAALAQAFRPEQQDGMFFSCASFALDPATRALRYAAAGRHPALLRRPGANILLRLETEQAAIGLADGAFEERVVTAPPGSALTLLSEGLSDALEDARGRPDVLDAILLDEPKPGTPEPFRIHEAIQGVIGRDGLDDDCSILAFAL